MKKRCGFVISSKLHLIFRALGHSVGYVCLHTFVTEGLTNETGCFTALIGEKREPRPFLHLRAGAQCRAKSPKPMLFCARG